VEFALAGIVHLLLVDIAAEVEFAGIVVGAET
jgi:hypothetical protein